MTKLVPSKFAIENSECDIERSNSIFNFLQEKQKVSINDSTVENICIPKVIIQFWDKADSIPKDVKKCMESWKALREKGYTYILFNEKSAREYISSNLNKEHLLAFDNCYHPAMKSDYFRLCYISYSGGMYVDSDDVYYGLNIDNYFINPKLKLQPLCYDLESNQMVKTQKLLNNTQNKRWVYYFNNNPIISAPFNPIISYALKRATNILLHINYNNLPEIQSTAGPGNITASIVAAYLTPPFGNKIEVIINWEELSKTIWFLSYRNDSRNWRMSNCKSFN